MALALLQDAFADTVAVARRTLTRAGTRARGRSLPLVYDRAYRELVTGVPLDAMRGERILAFLLHRGWAGRRDLVRPAPAALESLHRVHRPSYLRTLDDPGSVGDILGLPVDAHQARAAVRLQRLMTGGTLEAASRAVRSGRSVIHLGGGLHHASSTRGRGFCLMNDVAVAVRELRAVGFRQPVSVVDLDIHDGDGTREIFARDSTVHTYSIHNEAWGPTDAVASTNIALGEGVEDRDYLAVLEETLPKVIRAHRPGLVIYIAGADVASGDLYGNWEMSAEGILRRDRFVVETARRELGPVPFLVLLGGGYGGAAWRPPARFLAWLLSGGTAELPDDLSAALRRVRWLEQETDGSGGAGPLDWTLEEGDLHGVLPAAGEETRLLGCYGRREVEEALERFGVLAHVRARGYPNPHVTVLPSTGLGPTLRVHGSADRGPVLMELRLDVDRRMIPDMELLAVEWLLLQDPGRPFPPHRQPLPGQEHPGLGALADLVAWLVSVCRDLGLDGLGFRSSHFHMAELARRHLRFLRWGDADRFRRIRQVLRGMSLADASRAVARGTVTDPSTGEALEWADVPMIVPVSDRLRRYLREGGAGPRADVD